MKRLFLILIMFGVLCLCACQEEYGILDYQNKNIVAECLVNGEYRVVLTKKDSLCTLTVVEPREAQGVSFELSQEGTFAISGDTKIEMDKGALGGVCAILEIFSQSEECLTSATEEGQGSVFTFQRDTCTYQITLGKNDLPQSVKIVSEGFEYHIEICSMELT